MKICFLADGRSSIAKSWIQEIVRRGHEVHLISSYECPADAIPGAHIHSVPFAFAGLSKIRHDGTVHGHGERSYAGKVLAELRSGKLSALGRRSREWLAPLDIFPNVGRIRSIIRDIRPDMVHAMRLPFEGIMAALVNPPTPLLISIWGNDLTLHASGNPVVGHLTRKALRRADALHSDCSRDLELATKWGFDARKPKVLLPGAGGIRRNVFHPASPDRNRLDSLGVPPGAVVILNPRGFRQYVRNDVFFQAIALIVRRCPNAFFLALGMESNPVAESWIRKLNISDSVRLMGNFGHDQMADVYRLAEITVSPANHDGTPNTLIEAMSCGCFPIAGNIESIREWIRPGWNGLLCDPNDPTSLADAVVQAIQSPTLMATARSINQSIICERADFDKSMDHAEEFYCRCLGGTLNRQVKEHLGCVESPER